MLAELLVIVTFCFECLSAIVIHVLYTSTKCNGHIYGTIWVLALSSLITSTFDPLALQVFGML